MTVLLLTSATGAPGVTTTALALALTWPRSVLLVDADRDSSQAVLAGWLRAAPVTSGGLVDLAQAHREIQPIAPLVWEHSVPLTGGTGLARIEPRGSRPRHDQQRNGDDGPAADVGEKNQMAGSQRTGRFTAGTAQAGVARRFLPGFSNPGSAAVFGPVWSELSEALAGLAGGGVDVIVDAGRPGHTGLPPALLAVADIVALTVRSSLRSLAAARLHLPALRERLAEAPGARSGLVVVGPGRPYSDAEVEREFALPVLVDMAWGPDEAAVLSDGLAQPRHFLERPVMRGARAAASALSSVVRAPADEPLPAGTVGAW